MVGSRLAKQLAEADKQVVVVVRSPMQSHNANLSYATADAASIESLLTAAPNATVVYNCANPPNYHKWHIEWPPMAKAISDYAIQTGADLVTSSNLYGYGPYDGVLTEDLPLNAEWKNGKVRAQMWLDAKALHDAGQLRVTEVRGSDYICATAFSRMGYRVVPPMLLGKRIQLFGSLDQPHTWTDPNDVARLMKILGEDDRSWGKVWHVPSNKPKTQREVVADIAQAVGVLNYRLSTFSPFMERLIGLFNPVVKELTHTSYQFNAPFIMSSKAATETFGLTATPWPKVIEGLVKPYLDYAEKNGTPALAKLSAKDQL